MRRLINIIFILFLALCSNLHAQIKYVGSETIEKFIRHAQRYYKASIFFIDSRSGSEGGERLLMEGEYNLGGVARRVSYAYLRQGLTGITIGYDAISVIVNVQNPIKKLTLQQLHDIFRGEITNWKDVGGEDGAIKLYLPNKKSGTHLFFSEHVMNKESFGGNITVAATLKNLYKFVQLDRFGISIISYSAIIGNTKIYPLWIDDQYPSTNNLYYPIIRPLNLCTKGRPRGEVKRFLDWALSRKGQRVLKRRFIALE